MATSPGWLNRTPETVRFGPADPLGHGRLRHEVGPRDLTRSQAANRAQRERDGRCRCQGGLSAQEVQLERVVHRLDRSGQGLALDAYLAPPPGGIGAGGVEELAPGHDCPTGAWSACRLYAAIQRADLGIGSGHAAVSDQEQALRVLGFPEGYFCAYLIGLGYPADRRLRPLVRPGRRPFDEVVHWDRW